MRYWTGLVLLLAWSGGASAVTPRLDSSPEFFSGEWAGNGGQGSYCYLRLRADGWGWVLIDGGSGDWLAARMRWSNRGQALHVERIVPVPASIELRVMPLKKFALDTEFNQSLRLIWNEQSGACQLQKIDAAEGHLARARSAIKGLISGDGKR